ncbi:MAG: UvrD-helicase domain-containing protein [Algisphaera sp.]
MPTPSPHELLDGLTDPQKEAALHADGPLLVLAGPGSGKTRVITCRIAYLIKGLGIAPWNVLAITFTNKAAGEMRDRVAQLVTERQARALTVATFHSLCARLLRQYGDKLGLKPGYSIYDMSDQKRAMKQVLADLEINSKNFPPAAMLSTISNAKNDLQTAADFARGAGNFYDKTVAKVYTQYEKILTRNDALDFDDLLLKTVKLVQHHPEVLAELRERYQYVMIDEYQDTNHAQFMIAHALSSGHQNLMVTGDPDQSIYGWRGADITNILDFESHYPGAKLVRLEQNYRSTPSILAAADALIQNNEGRRHKKLWTDNPEGDPVHIVTCGDERSEASWVADTFKRLNEGVEGRPAIAWGHMAVFYRMNSLSRVMEDTLRDAGIPYQIARGTAFYDRKEIKDAIAFLRVVANPADEVNLLRIINTPARGISPATVKHLRGFSISENMPIDRVLENAEQITGINKRAQNSVAKFAATLQKWRGAVAGDTSLIPDPTLRGFVEDVLADSGLETFYQNDTSDPDRERLANLGELITSAQQFEEEMLFEAEREQDGAAQALSLSDKLLSFLERIALVSDADSIQTDQGSVTLMTLHAAKGLEFPAVAMIGFEDGLLPHSRSSESPSELEEERRLAFVGITRAEKHLYLCHAKYRTVFGQSGPTIKSRFLSELPADVTQTLDASDDGTYFEEDPWGDSPTEWSRDAPSPMTSHQRDDARVQRSLADGIAAQFPPGTVVRHPKFGLGRVVNVATTGASTRAKICFNTAGNKTLVLQYARLEIITG